MLLQSPVRMVALEMHTAHDIETELQVTTMIALHYGIENWKSECTRKS